MSTEKWEQFVRVWQAAADVPQVAREFGRAESTCRTLANYMRNHGVPLKKFNARIGWEQLRLLAAALGPKEQQGAHHA